MITTHSRTFCFLLFACLCLVIVDGKIRGEQSSNEDERELQLLKMLFPGKTLPPGGILAKFKRPKPVATEPTAPVKAPKKKEGTAKAPTTKAKKDEKAPTTRDLEEESLDIDNEERELQILKNIIDKLKKKTPTAPVAPVKPPVKGKAPKAAPKAAAPKAKTTRDLEEETLDNIDNDERELQLLKMLFAGKTLPPGGILAKFKKPKPVAIEPTAPVKEPKKKEGKVKAPTTKAKKDVKAPTTRDLEDESLDNIDNDERELQLLKMLFPGKTLPPGGILGLKKPKPVASTPTAPVKAPKSKGPTKAKAPIKKRVLQDEVDEVEPSFDDIENEERNLQIKLPPAIQAKVPTIKAQLPPRAPKAPAPKAPKAPVKPLGQGIVPTIKKYLPPQAPKAPKAPVAPKAPAP